jgi:PAS domain S-box-containing protein
MNEREQDRKKTLADAADLRKRAEEQAGAAELVSLSVQTPEAIEQLIHELRVHQIELEMQNEELRTAQAEIEAGLARYFDLYDLAPVGYVTVSEEGLILEANLTITTLLGVNRGALVKQPLTRFILKEDQDIYYLHHKILFETGKPQRCELRLVKPDGSAFWAWLDGAFAEGSDGKPVCRVVLSDITEQKQAEAEILRLNEELEQRVAERTTQLEAVNKELQSFAYSISHDFRAPLRALDGFSASLQAKYDEHLDDEGRHYLDRIRNAAIYMSNLVDDLLDLSRITRQEFRKQQVDLSKLAAEIFAALQESEPQRQTTIKITPDLQVRGDAALLQSALQNLLENAWKFSSKEVQAEIEVGRTTVEGEAVFFIRDNGAGFNMAYADKLFGAFQRLHKVGEFPGTGIGLATVQRIVNRHGGRIWAESEVGKGATFYFTLPG